MRSRTLLAVLVLSACSGRPLRGTEENAADGRTALSVDDDAGCEVWVDGVRWPHAPHVEAPIAAGLHHIECGPPEPGSDARIAFEVRARTVFHFDYWGP